mmetsp:Transcript_8167/g.15406  ORF Transcript_8167/g.15406 Transcript_8167/m.15406 type:complete len:102 (+) Transcript_8167:1417-1722(+)
MFLRTSRSEPEDSEAAADQVSGPVVVPQEVERRMRHMAEPLPGTPTVVGGNNLRLDWLAAEKGVYIFVSIVVRVRFGCLIRHLSKFGIEVFHVLFVGASPL